MKGLSGLRTQRVHRLDFVRQQVTGLAIAGLYHLWERLVKEFLEISF